MKIVRLLKRLLLLVASLMLIGFSGCPDYSHLRPVPDYDNMVDGGETIEQTQQTP